MQDLLARLEAAIADRFAGDSTGHDLAHLKRVMNVALHIQETEGGDRLILAASALLHDLHRLMEKATGTFCPPKNSLPEVAEILAAVDFPADQRAHVLHCVEYHEEYPFSSNGNPVEDIETLVLQDADNLDAIGAVGVARTFMFGGAHGVPMYTPEHALDRAVYDSAERDPSVIHHFHSKLLRLKDHMNTATAREMAAARHAYMVGFVAQFMAEWEGER